MSSLSTYKLLEEAGVRNFESYDSLSDLVSDILSAAKSIAPGAGAKSDNDAIRRAIVLIENAVAFANDAGDDTLIGDTNLRLGVYRTDIHDTEAAIKSFEIALEAFQKVGDSSRVLKAQNGIGTAYFVSGRFKEALLWYEACHELVVLQGDPRSAVISHLNIGYCSERLCDYGKALEHLNVALNLIQGTDDLESEAKVYLGLGNVSLYLGDFSGSIQAHLRSLELNERLQRPRGAAMAMMNLGSAFLLSGDTSSALSWLLKAKEQYELMGNRLGLSHVYANLANVYASDRTRQQEVVFMWLKSIEVARELNDVAGLSFGHSSLGAVLIEQNKLEDAKHHLDIACNLALAHGNIPTLVSSMRSMSQYHKVHGDLPRCREMLGEALELAKANTLRVEEEALVRDWSQLEEDAGNYKEALRHQRQANELEKQLLSERNFEKIQKLQMLHAVEKAQRDSQIHKDRLDELKEAHRKLQEVNQSKNEVLSITAHDLKNPLQAIRMLADYARQYQREQVSEDVFQTLTMISSTAQNLYQTVTQMLDLESLDRDGIAIHPRPANIHRMLENSVGIHRRVAEQKGISVTLYSSLTELDFITDIGLFRQIVDNLVSNALKYSGPNTTVTIRASEQNNPRLGETDAQGLARRVTVEVEDQGAGISEADLAKLFQPFVRLSSRPTAGEHSTGLGLAIVKKLVSALNGDVFVRSELGKGSCFGFFLPEFPAISHPSKGGAQ